MGVVCVINFPVPEGKSGQQTVDILQKRIEDMGAQKTGNFIVECETYHSNPSLPPRILNILHNSEQPVSTFAVLDSTICLVADNLFDLLINKMEQFYPQRKNVKVESKGQRYELGDFIIKIGSVILGQNISFKGILVEVEYCPSVVLTDCINLMKEFMHSFMGPSLESLPNHLKNKKDPVYTPSDTIIQYLEHFDNLKKLSIPPAR